MKERKQQLPPTIHRGILLINAFDGSAPQIKFLGKPLVDL